MPATFTVSSDTAARVNAKSAASVSAPEKRALMANALYPTRRIFTRNTPFGMPLNRNRPSESVRAARLRMGIVISAPGRGGEGSPSAITLPRNTDCARPPDARHGIASPTRSQVLRVLVNQPPLPGCLDSAKTSPRLRLTREAERVLARLGGIPE